ncbi:hypothetical protein TEA_016826 [Camellia sinensis var. sinensis]|uniref:Phorbol-ester/DAG-type domain-containing protein n=2 Tax=Camellia sinensis TaxID=4442 RepID=A0A4S4EBM0_CAMSN|nr:hypothetical protein TEA_016826 [Camellia sinensis var. sinensis]
MNHPPIACDGRTLPILAPFYRCSKCNFTLHECCAKLPSKMKHLIRPYHLFILNRWQSKYPDIPLMCHACEMSCKGLLPGCVSCDFFNDITCASILLGSIMHNTHPYLLTPSEIAIGICTACHKRISGYGLVCDICNFKLHTQCAVLPLTVRHRYDKHPFFLRDYGNEDEYYCEICEGEIKPNCWFYHCGDCNQDLHTECIRPVNSLQQEVRHESYMHTLVPKEMSNVLCTACNYPCSEFGLVCDSCNFVLYTQCASLPLAQKVSNCNKFSFILTYSTNKDEIFVTCATKK